MITVLLVLLVLLGCYVSIGTFGSLVLLLGAGIDIRAGWSVDSSVRELRSGLRSCWGWPWYMLKAVAVDGIGSVLVAVKALIRYRKP